MSIKLINQHNGILTGIISLISFILILSFINIGIAQSDGQEFPAFNVCCEKTLGGAWCQNAKDDQCNPGFRKTPTSCDATSFCKLGCCVDSAEGLCMENTPQRVCEESKGTWLDDSQCQVSQCNLGCCIVGDQASFVTQTRCKRLSSLYGLETNFRNDIADEESCIETVYSSEKGACVFDFEGSRNCEITTRGNCQKSGGNRTSKGEFFKDYLCTADDLGTDCGPTKETICVEARDEIYFKDSCGNPANIYDSNKIYSRNPGYWQKIVQKSDSCGAGDDKGNMGSKTCGNCNYLSGSICKKGQATYGDLACKDLNCYNTKNGNDYKNGESWCMYQSSVGDGKDAVGSRHFRHVCIQGEETVEACADFRNEVCIQEELSTTDGKFIEAACRVNRWVDCIDQFEEDDCLNNDKRTCFWVKGYHYDGSSSVSSKDAVVNPELAEKDPEKENSGILVGGDGICLPNSPPGLEFWQESNAKQICSLGNSKQTVLFETGFLGGKECDENCEVLTGKWVSDMNFICKSLGDCGNYINLKGRFTDDGVVVKDNQKKRVISQGIAEDAKIEDEKGFFGDLFD